MDSILSTIVTSAVVSTVVGAAVNAWLENRKSRTATRLDALSAAVTLEGYAINCADKISNHKLAVDSDGHAGAYLGSVPELSEVKIVIGFIHPKKAFVANKLMIFPQEIRQADQVVAFWWDVTADIEQVREVVVCEVAKVGLRAHALAAELRSAFGLPSRGLVFGKFDVYHTLKKGLKKDMDC
jgi:hypothetical protein